MEKKDMLEELKAQLGRISSITSDIRSTLETHESCKNEVPDRLVLLLGNVLRDLELAKSESQSLVNGSTHHHPAQLIWLPSGFSKIDVELMKGDDPWDLVLANPLRGDLFDKMQQLLESQTLDVLSSPPEGTPVVIVEEGRYYRGITKSSTSKTGKISVLKIDVDELSWVNSSQLFNMPKDVAIFPCQVIRCTLNINDVSLKTHWELDLKSHFSQLCEYFPLQMYFAQKLTDSNPPKFYVKVNLCHKTLNEQVDIGNWLERKLFPALKDTPNGEDPSDTFLRLGELLSPFSIPVDALFDCDQISEGSGCCVSSGDLNELPVQDGMGLHAVSDVPNDPCYEITPHPVQIKRSIVKVRDWMGDRQKKIFIEEPSFDCHPVDLSVFAASKDSSNATDSGAAELISSTSSQTTGGQQEVPNIGDREINPNTLYLPEEGESVKLIVHHVLSGTSFSASIHEFSIGIGYPGSPGGLTMHRLYVDLNETDSHPSLQSPPHIGQAVLAQGLQRYLNNLGIGKKWLRAVVRAIDRDKADVFFADFGNTESVFLKDLRILQPEFSQLPFQAISVKLAMIETLEQCKLKAQSMLTRLAKGKTLMAEITKKDVSSSSLEVVLYKEDGHTSINNLLAAEELCVPV